jgi:hypothetical protein
MVSQGRWFPDEDNNDVVLKGGTSDLTSNSGIFCPELKCGTCICQACYTCEYGFNGVCDNFMRKVRRNPEIINELYRPVPELVKEDSSSALLACDGKILSIGDPRDRRKKLYLLKYKFSLEIRFIPKYEKVSLPYLDEIFLKEGVENTFTHDEICFICEGGDTIYSINTNDKDLETIKLMEKLNCQKPSK